MPLIRQDEHDAYAMDRGGVISGLHPLPPRPPLPFTMDCGTFQKLVARALKSENSNLALFKRISRQSELRFE